MAYESFVNTEHNNRAISLAENEQLLSPLGLSGLLGYTATRPVYADGTGGRTLKMRAGVRATIRGTRFNNLTETLIGPDQILANTSGSPRKDLLVLRLDRAAAGAKAFTVSPVMLTGNASASPVAPSPVTNNTIDGTGFWDLPILELDVANGATSFTEANIKPRHWYATGSGYVGWDTARPPVEPGVLFQAVDTGITYIGKIDGTWARVHQNTGMVDIAVPAGWSAGPFRVGRDGNTVILTGRVTRTGAALANTASPVVGRVDEDFRPGDEGAYGVYHCSLPDHSSQIAIDSGGAITFGGTQSGDGIAQNAVLYVNATWLAKS